MRIGSCVFTVLLGAMLGGSVAAPFDLSVESGQALLKSKAGGSWTTISSGAVDFGDSLFIPAPHTAEIRLDPTTTLLLKDSCRIVLQGTDSLVQLELIGGQVFLKREGEGGAPFRINAGSCTFIPVGTAAAVKIASNGEPRVAVLRGTIRMDAPGGKTMDVGPGFFGSFSRSSGSLSRQKLPPRAIQSLTEWSGVELEQLAQAAPEEGSGEEAGEPEPAADSAQSEEGEQEAGEEPVMAQDSAAQQEQPAAEPEPAAEEAAPMARTVATVPDADTAGTAIEEEPEPAPAKEQKKTGAEEAAGHGEETKAQAGEKSAEAEEKSAKEGEKKKAKKDTGAAKKTAGGPAGAPPAKEEEVAEKGEPEGDEREKDKPQFEIGAGTVTVGEEQWTRIAFAVDVPIWRFGICFDLELFLDAQGQFSNKGWDFSEDNWARSLSRKIRYIRFNHPGDPVYARFMGLDNVTFAYGFVVDRFSNMLNYPDEKLVGLRFDLNDLGPIGLTLQTMVSDFHDFRNDGGVVAGRFALKPLKPTGAPIIKGVDLGVTYATDLNQYSPAREWDLQLTGDKWDRDNDGETDSTYLYQEHGQEPYYGQLVNHYRSANDYDEDVEHRDAWASRAEDKYSVLGFDIGIPIISTKILGLDIYGQYGMSMDGDDKLDTVDTEGWGIGAPGVALRAGPFWARVEYRRIQGMFEPGYFGPYYLEERLERDPIAIKESSLEDATLSGVFGTAGLSIADIFIASASYQRLGKGTDPELDQRFEATGALGGVLLEKIPKLNKAEVYLYKSQIQRTVVGYMVTTDGDILWDQPRYDEWFFERTPNTYWGYRIGAEVMAGASIVWDTRYGWKLKGNELVDDKSVTLGAALTF